MLAWRQLWWCVFSSAFIPQLLIPYCGDWAWMLSQQDHPSRNNDLMVFMAARGFLCLWTVDDPCELSSNTALMNLMSVGHGSHRGLLSDLWHCVSMINLAKEWESMVLTESKGETLAPKVYTVFIVFPSNSQQEISILINDSTNIMFLSSK